jgi:hypothetical protein
VEEAVERIQNGQLKYTTRNGDAEVPEQRSPQEKYHPHTMDTTFFNRRATRLLTQNPLHAAAKTAKKCERARQLSTAYVHVHDIQTRSSEIALNMKTNVSKG